MEGKKKQIIINIDDTGNHPDTILAAIELWQNKCISSVSLMAYGPDFDNTAEKLKSNPIPLGIHLGANHGEPIIPADQVPSLCDEEGRFFDTDSQILGQYQISEMEKEYTAQIEKVLDNGLNPVFLDSHMGLLYMREDLQKLHVKLAEKYRLSISLPEGSIFNRSRESLRASGLQASDGLFMEYFLPDNCQDDLQGRMEQYEAIFKELKPGLYYFATHPMLPTPSAQEEFGDFPVRKADYRFFSSSQWQDLMKKYEVELVSF